VNRSHRPRSPLIAIAGPSILAALLVLTAGVPDAAAVGEVRIARLQYGGGGDWYCDPSSLPNWLEGFAQRTGVPTAATEAVVTLDSEELYRYPFLYLSGHGRIALTETELAELRRYLDGGGFLYADDNYGLDASFRAMVARLYPEEELAPLAADHPVFRSFYDLPGPPKIHRHDGEPARAFGVTRNGRLVVLYTWSADIGDGLEDPDVHGDPPEVREAAMRRAVNVLTYALTRP
jgi:hypothetical protein